MNFYIRLLIVLSISGCVAVDVSDIPRNMSNLISFERKSPNVKFKALNVPSSNLIISHKKIKKSYELVDKNNDYLSWHHKSINLEMLNGKFMKSYGLQNDFQIVMDEKDIPHLLKTGSSFDAFISFSDPITSYLKISYKYKKINLNKINIDYLDLDESHTLIEEKFNATKIKWKGRNLYLLNKDGEVIYSEQQLTPLAKKVKYYYK